MLKKIVLLIGADANKLVLETLIELCKAEAVAYCNLDEFIPELEPAAIQMVIERYNKLGYEGLDSQSGSNISLSFVDGYSKPTYRMLQKYRKIRTVKEV